MSRFGWFPREDRASGAPVSGWLEMSVRGEQKIPCLCRKSKWCTEVWSRLNWLSPVVGFCEHAEGQSGALRTEFLYKLNNNSIQIRWVSSLYFSGIILWMSVTSCNLVTWKVDCSQVQSRGTQCQRDSRVTHSKCQRTSMAGREFVFTEVKQESPEEETINN